MPDSAPVFRGLVALELRDGAAPVRDAVDATRAGELAAMVGRDLAALVPSAAAGVLGLMGAHVDPAEVLRPGWPLHTRVQELLLRAPGRAAGARVVGFGSDGDGVVPMPLQGDASLSGGGLRVLPFVLQGVAGDALEELLFDRGMAAADTALALQDAFGAAIEHARYLSLHDLAALMAMQYRNVGLAPLWSLLETALVEPDARAWVDAAPEPLACYVDGEVRIALLDPAAWRARNAADVDDCARLERGFAVFQARQRQYAAVLQAHGVPVNFVHCPDGDAACLA